MQLVIHHIEGELEDLNVEYLVIFDIDFQGQIGICANHEKISGAGNYFFYNTKEGAREDHFLYAVENNRVDIYLF